MIIITLNKIKVLSDRKSGHFLGLCTYVDR